jgi:hypothetical protein
MAIRITAEEVLDIMDSGVEVSSAQFTAMIKAASLMIDKVFENDSDVTDELLTELERWLTAHLLSSTLTRMAAKEKIGDAEITYTGKWGELLKSTPYGQMVLILDITGKIANTGKMAARMYAIPNFDD